MSRPDDLAIIDAALRGEDDGSELASLVADVRASAPRMSPALERRLEEVMRPEPVREGRRRWWLLAPAGGVAALVAGVVAVSMTGSGGDEVSRFTARPASGGAHQTAPAQHAPPSHAEGASGAATAQSPRLAPSGAVPAGAGRRVERDASLTLAAAPRDFNDVSDGVVRTTDRVGGIVQRSNVEQVGRGGSATFDLRIPVSRLDDALAALSRLAHVQTRSAGTQDVTRAFDAATGRLADARAERRALLRALTRATTAQQAAGLRAQLREVRERIARARRAVDALRRRTDLARVSVMVVTGRSDTAIPPRGGHWTPRDALHTAVRVLEIAVGAALVALAALTPVALLAALALAAARVARRRRREAALG